MATRTHLLGSAVLLVLGCAAEIARAPIVLTPVAGGEPRTLRVREAVPVTPSTGFTKIIKADSTWRLVGSLPQGEVYKPVGDVFAIEGANVHEAYLVIDQGEVVGFYLPGERAFARLPDKVRLPTVHGAP